MLSQFKAVELQFTPKAFANFSPGLERQRQPWVTSPSFVSTLKGLFPHRFKTLSALVLFFNSVTPGFSLCSNPGLKLANAFGVKVRANPGLKLANAFGVKVRANPGLKLANAFGVKVRSNPGLKLAHAFGVNPGGSVLSRLWWARGGFGLGFLNGVPRNHRELCE